MALLRWQDACVRRKISKDCGSSNEIERQLGVQLEYKYLVDL